MDSRIAIASDHAGYDLKMKLVDYLKEKGFEVLDYGAHSSASADYPDFAHPLAKAVDCGEFTRGITICGSGNGINMTSNKYQGVRAALCWEVEIAKLAREHNDANICSIPARFVSDELAFDIVDTFLCTGFEGGRHKVRIDKIPIKK